MKNLRVLLRAYFGFNRRETNGFFLLSALLAGLLISWFWVKRGDWPQNPDTEAATTATVLDSLLAALPAEQETTKFSTAEQLPNTPTQTAAALFAFDPNLADEATFVALGLKPWLAERILKYRSKGGKFRKPEDLQKIYGFPERDFERLRPYIQIGQQPQTATARPDKDGNWPTERPAPAEQANNLPKWTFDLNAADTTELKKIRGIGSTLAARLVKFRDKLGGFHSAEQVRELYGITPEAVAALLDHGFVAEGATVRQIPINTATAEQLQAHPYLDWKLAKAIVAHRKQHGAFASPEALAQVSGLPAETARKLAPYLSF